MLRIINTWLRSLVMGVGRFLTSLRYDVKISGLDKIPNGMTKTVVLPNHPAYIDPIILVPHLWKKIQLRPMILGKMLDTPVTWWASWLLQPIRVPEMNTQSKSAREEAQNALQETIDGLQSGTNHIVYPAGRLYRWNQEQLGSVRGLTEILKSVPDARILVVRTKGLWGSRFSYAYDGEKPSFVKTLLKGALIVLSNLIFFCPRRRVNIEIKELDRSELPPLERPLINRFFESWYNEGGPEEPTYVPYHFLVGPRTREFPTVTHTSHLHPRDIKKATQAAVIEMLEERLERKLSDREKDSSTPLESLGMDSLDRMELSLDIEQRFRVLGGNIPTTILEAWALADGLLNAGEDTTPDPIWKNTLASTKTLVSPKGNTVTQAITEALLVNNDSKNPLVADSVSGTLSTQRFLIAAWIISKRIKKMAGKRIAIALPATVASDIVYFATLLADKEPVILNWTTGPVNVIQGMKLAQVKTVITSKTFMDRIHMDFKPAKVVTMESIRKGIGKTEKILAALTVKYFPQAIRKAASRTKPDSPAAILFTSGSEKAPKVVPLTHKSLLAAVRSACQAFEINNHDVVMSFLPPFHVFGLVVLLMAFTNNLRIVHHPDPTVGGKIAKKIKAYGATIVPSTPTFLSFILDRASSDDLASIRLAVVGAEKCPSSLFDRFNKATNGGSLFEGYGCTECCAIATANTQTHYRKGSLGYPMPAVEIQIAHPDTLEPLDQGEKGTILIKGDTLFNGYMSQEHDPFVLVKGSKWYNTGDIGSIDNDGYVWFHGRLKRFVKIGGEMISLPSLEEPLIQKYPVTEDGPRIAIEARDREGSVHIVLFTTLPDLDLLSANKLISEYGYRGLMRVHEVRIIDQIPLLGSGKIDYKSLKAQLEAEV